MLKEFRKLIRDESGATAIEYALIASLISVAIITTATQVGTSIGDVFTQSAPL